MKRKGHKLIYKILLIALVFIFIYLGISIRYPIKYMDIIVKNSKDYGTDPYLIAAIINVESSYNKNAKSSKDAKGLMQITEGTGRWGSQEVGISPYYDERLYEPEVNIKIGTWYVSRLFREFNGELDLVLAAYNAGSGNVNKWLKNPEYSIDGERLDKIPFKETENYLVKVKKNYNIYKSVHRKRLI